ncbi:MAG: hypothetical protein WA952_03025 [Lewinella sp.]
MRLTSKQNTAILQDVLLNRIEGLNWSYYDVDLNASFGSGSTEDMKADLDTVYALLDDVEYGSYGKFRLKDSARERSSVEIVRVLYTIIRNNPAILQRVLQRLFDTNAVKNLSAADEGNLGRLNRNERDLRNQVYLERIRHDHRESSANAVILAEGDSWFQFPRLQLNIDPVKDIVDWLIDREHYAIYSLAAGGDWFSNIFQAGEYIEELPKVSPDVFLLSGGGNDLVGSYRVALMVINPYQEARRTDQCPRFRTLSELRKDVEGIDRAKYELGIRLLKDEFFSFINLYFIQYLVFLSSLYSAPQYKKMLMVTQGYDFSLPYHGSRSSFLSLRRLVNVNLETGTWLFDPLKMKGVTKHEEQIAIVYAMITEFNEMLIKLARFDGLPNVYHIDCRGVARSADDWYDELHLTSEAYGTVAAAYTDCIDRNLRRDEASRKGEDRVYKAVNYWT